MTEQESIPTRPPSVMEDPSAVAVARVYADAFLNAAGDNAPAALEEFTSFVDDVLEQHPDFSTILTTGFLGRDDKIDLINRVVGPYGSELFTNMLRVLARHQRLDLLPLILRQSWIEHEHREGKRRVHVRTAVELSEETLSTIRNRLSERFPFDPVLIPAVDPSLLGGIVVQVGDTVFDSSLRNRMKQLRKQLRQRSLHEIQSGRDRFSHPEGD